ncbi:FAA hydrolase family protein [Duganella sp. FT135W]|uniref:FAA hydrolase family protein n=1 Tax=Duganella flavida TaxID=2692175 RepID=A0A6L8KD26_9BURK|nr:fumarylacetoacetate hydrolase family protein [Duganella flavida]MYM24960.1 FAA hydrolase family protein [Duganella flavida]
MWHAIASYDHTVGKGGTRLALVAEDHRLYDVAQLIEAGALGEGGPRLAPDLGSALQNWEVNAALLEQMSRALPPLLASGRVAPLVEQSYRLCVPYTPGRIFGAASNFYEHAREMGTELAPRTESMPFCFMKAETSVTATDTDVVMPASTEKLDWEVELGVIIGKTCRNVSVEQAYDVIAGYTVFNDVTARDLNRRSDYPFKHDWFRGKSHDTFGPMGPWVVPRSCIEAPQSLRLKLSVNGEMMQNDTADAMIFNIAEQIAYLSGMLTLKPGDLLATGTPAGVGMGREIYLKPGDEMIASIEKIGSIRNRVVAA